MRTIIQRSMIGLLVTFMLFSAIAFAGNAPAKKANINRDIAIENLLVGISSDNYGLRTTSAYMLGELESSEAVIKLMKMLREEKNEDARIMAALSLYKIGDARGINAIKQAIKFDDSEKVSKTCALFYQSYLATQKN